MQSRKKSVTVYIDEKLNLRVDSLVLSMKHAEIVKPKVERRKISKALLIDNLLRAAVLEAEKEVKHFEGTSDFYDWLISH